MNEEQTNPAFDMSPEAPLETNGSNTTKSGNVDSQEDSKSSPVLKTATNLDKNDENIDKKGDDKEDGQPERMMWGNQLEFLMSCIATSVGLGNVWRFPFVAYQNGGGAFIIPYVIVLFLVGKPMYYLECILGQFSSRNSVRIWSLAPGMKGTGYAQLLGCGYVLSYYVSIIALCLYYFAYSFMAELPWSVCAPEWENCVPSIVTAADDIVIGENATSSAELYFVKTVLQQKDGVEGGLGLPVWYLTLCLFISWLLIFFIVARGVKSSGKAAYFLALFPYVVMIILLITTCILPGAGNGIAFFFTPQWDKLIVLDVWYAAVTQVFFSLTVGTGPIIMFSSYNRFRQNIYRDAMIVTTLDTFTSLLSGVTIFGILGNLAHNLDRPDVGQVVGSGGTSLAFVSYPDAIAKTFQPQLFSVLFFLMMSVLGIGSAVALLQAINTVMIDAFPRIRVIYMSAFCCTVGFAIGLIYVTPGGQYILELVDHYGGTFLILFCAMSEIVGVVWIYGLENICTDIDFMLNIKTSVYWRFCWGFITPAIMFVVFFYALIASDEPKFADVYVYPTIAYVFGYLLLVAGMVMVPIFAAVVLYKNRTGDFKETIKKCYRAKPSWGPRSPLINREWKVCKEEAKRTRSLQNAPILKHCWYSLTGGYSRNVKL